MPNAKPLRLLVFASILLLNSSTAFSENPADLDYHLRFTKNQPMYRPGEVIQFELSYASKSDQSYRGRLTNPNPYLGNVTLHLEPEAGTSPNAFIDLSKYPPEATMFSILGGPGFLTAAPIVTPGELTEWFHFVKPGRYSLRVTSKQVSRVKAAADLNDLEPVTLESNAAAFTIEAPDSAWESQEISNILQEIQNDPGTAQRGCTRLAALDTPASMREIANLYLASAEVSSQEGAPREVACHQALRRSRQLSTIISELEKALVDARRTAPSGIVHLLAELKTRDLLGDGPEQSWASDPAHREELQKLVKQRAEVQQRNFAHYNAQLLATVPQRGGSERASALYEAWFSTERAPDADPGQSSSLDRLRSDVLASVSELSPDRQLEFLTGVWGKMPHDILLPLARLMAPDHPEALKNLCEAAPLECTALIIAQVQDPERNLQPWFILYLQESPQPKLDEFLRRRLITGDSPPQTSALVLRIGSANLRDSVVAFLDNPENNTRLACETRSHLLGYLYRVAPKEARKRFNDTCAPEAFRLFSKEASPERFLDTANDTLGSADSSAAGHAAQFLAFDGPASSLELIQARLDTLHRSPPHSAQAAGELEMLLAGALMKAKNWKLTISEIAILRAACMTDGCREIADGRMSMAF